MLSAFIPSEHSYPAVPLARQLVHHRLVHPGLLILGTAPLKYPTPTADRDRTVLRTNSTITGGVDYTFTLFPGGRRMMITLDLLCKRSYHLRFLTFSRYGVQGNPCQPRIDIHLRHYSFSSWNSLG